MYKRQILDILFPKECVSCAKQGRYVCDKCQGFISENALICPVCHKASFGGKTHLECLGRHDLDGLVSIWDYDGVIKEAIHNIKYAGLFDMLKDLTKDAFKLISLDQSQRFDPFLTFLSQDNTYITYVPMFLKKERQRGFNQAKIISQEIAQKINKPAISLLEKIRETKDQASLIKEDRLQNVKDSFVTSLAHELSSCKSCLLVDDVFTTGTTMQECCKVLKKSGIEKVWGFVLARAI